MCYLHPLCPRWGQVLVQPNHLSPRRVRLDYAQVLAHYVRARPSHWGSVMVHQSDWARALQGHPCSHLVHFAEVEVVVRNSCH